jgi:hypothetical protein
MPTEVKHLMIDIETLGTKLSSVVTSVALVPFTMLNGPATRCESLIRGLHIGDQLVNGRTIDPSTLEWWTRQSVEARRVAFSGNCYFDTFHYDVRMFLAQCDYQYLWCKGPAFDAAMLESLLETFGAAPSPFNYKRWRDVRTFCDGVEYPSFEGTEHDAYDDCVNQIRHVCKAWVCKACEPEIYGEKK